MLKIIQNRNIFFILSGTLVLAAILALLVWGLKLGIDFTGGSLVELTFTDNRPSSQAITQVINESELGLDEVKIQPSGTNELIIRTKALSEDEHQALLSLLRDNFGPEQVVENRFESIGPVIGEELKNKAILAIIVALIMVVVYIAYAFRKVSKPVASWKYGLAAIIALAHDILIVTGVFAVLGYLMNIEVGILFVTALLTVLGYSVNDTIVVFDRVRENLIYRPRETFVETINASVNETITRSINTSFTTLLVLFTLYFLGGTTIRDFVLVLILGTIVGTYSSIFIASPILVVWQKLSRINK
jgi:preprotein translocase subunit SecF